MTEMINISFFTGPDCCLCDDAQILLAESAKLSEKGLLPAFTAVKYNVRDDHEHYHLYATRIPVLKRQDTGKELGWPFDTKQLNEFISK